MFSLDHPFFLSRGMICPLTILRLFSRCGQSEQSHFYENFYLKFPSKIHKNTNKIPEKTTHRSKCLKNSKALRKMIIWRDSGSKDRSGREYKVRICRNFQKFLAELKNYYRFVLCNADIWVWQSVFPLACAFIICKLRKIKLLQKLVVAFDQMQWWTLATCDVVL